MACAVWVTHEPRVVFAVDVLTGLGNVVELSVVKGVDASILKQIKEMKKGVTELEL